MADEERKLTGVYALLIELLSSQEAISSKDLLAATKQKYFDRRIRELRDEFGYDIVTEKLEGKHAYRLRSLIRGKGQPRTYLGAKQKRDLLNDSPKTCSLCGSQFTKIKTSVFDHRIPLIRGGEGVAANFQLLCQNCNNQKRTQCKGCDLNCKTCFFAFPEKFPKPITLRFTEEDLIELHKLAALNNQAVEDFLHAKVAEITKRKKN
jgi:hypothetical protein